MAPARIAFIGSGGRSVVYAANYVDCNDLEIAAIGDPDAGHRRTMMAKAGITGAVSEYDDWRELLAVQTKLDGVIIASPNFAHAEQAVACLERGLPIALEKPLATNQADCERILDAERDHGGRTLVGFVLRSTPFYSRIRELLQAGAIGKVLSVQADELPGLGVTSIMHRSGWRRKQALSGGAMLEKSCHDMDILNWLLDSRPLSLSAYGNARLFTPDPTLPASCDDCPPERRCAYYREPAFSAHEDAGEQVLHQFLREDSRCIYNIDRDTLNVQNVAIAYENGVLVNFMLTFNCEGPNSGRNIHIVGETGRIWGNLHQARVFLHVNAGHETTEFDASGDGSGHGGGDRLHALELRRMIQEPDYRPEQNAAAGYLSAVMSFAADTSALEDRRVRFAYAPDGRVRLH
jgi:predicted dehydrogenase